MALAIYHGLGFLVLLEEHNLDFFVPADFPACLLGLRLSLNRQFSYIPARNDTELEELVRIEFLIPGCLQCVVQADFGAPAQWILGLDHMGYFFPGICNLIGALCLIRIPSLYFVLAIVVLTFGLFRPFLDLDFTNDSWHFCFFDNFNYLY